MIALERAITACHRAWLNWSIGWSILTSINLLTLLVVWLVRGIAVELQSSCIPPGYWAGLPEGQSEVIWGKSQNGHCQRGPRVNSWTWARKSSYGGLDQLCLNQVMIRVTAWITSHGLALTVAKTKVVMFTPLRTPTLIPMTVGDVGMQKKTATKYLDVDCRLQDWKHI